MVMRGRPLKEVQEVLGHKSFSLTLRYAHVLPKHLRSAVESLNGLTPNPVAHDHLAHKRAHSVESGPNVEGASSQVSEISEVRP
jgi:integrase